MINNETLKTKVNLSNYFSKKLSKGKAYQYQKSNSKCNITVNVKDGIGMGIGGETPIHSIYNLKANKLTNSNPQFNTSQNSPDYHYGKGNKKEPIKIGLQLQPHIKPQQQPQSQGKDKMKSDMLFMNKLMKMHTKNSQSYHQLTHSNGLFNKTVSEMSSLQQQQHNKGQMNHNNNKEVLFHNRCNSTFEEKQMQLKTNSNMGYYHSKGTNNNSKKNSPRVFSSNNKKYKSNITSNTNSHTNSMLFNLSKENSIQGINIKDCQYIKTTNKDTNNNTNNNTNSNTRANANASPIVIKKSNQNLYIKYSSLLAQTKYHSKGKSSSGPILLENTNAKSIKNISIDFLSQSINQTKPNSRIQSKDKSKDKKKNINSSNIYSKQTSLIQSMQQSNNSGITTITNNHRVSNAKAKKSSLGSTKCSSSSLNKQNENNKFINTNTNSPITTIKANHFNGFGDNLKEKVNYNNDSNKKHPFYNSSQFAATSKNFLNLNDIHIIETITTNANAQSNSSLKNYAMVNKAAQKTKQKSTNTCTHSKEKLLASKNASNEDPHCNQNAIKTKPNAKSNGINKGWNLHLNYHTHGSNSNNKNKDITITTTTPTKCKNNKSVSDIKTLLTANKNNNQSINSNSNNNSKNNSNSKLNNKHSSSKIKYKSSELILTKSAAPQTPNYSPLSKSKVDLNYFCIKDILHNEDHKDKDISNEKNNDHCSGKGNDNDNDKESDNDNEEESIILAQNEYNTRHLNDNANYKSSQDTKNTIVVEPIIFNQPSNEIRNTQSIQSTIREASYYQLEMEKLICYIRQYHYSKGYYPQSNITFYKYGRLIGKGAFGKVNLALHILSGRLIAIKSFNKSKLKNTREKAKIKHEIQALRKLQHPFISKILDTFETDKHIMICMEYICGDLLSFIRKRTKLSEPSAKVIFKQIIEGLEFIHSKKIVHRDIKLDNILIDLNNTVKICDFGVSRKLNPGDIMHEHCGTLAYIAPEILMEDGYSGYTCDIWSAGVTLYYMLSGVQPFKVNNNNDTFKDKVIKGEYEPLTNVSFEAQDLIKGMLQVEPKKRLTINQILAHPWLVDVNLRLRSNINLFTNAEKSLLRKYDVNYLKSNNEEMIENFTIKNLDTLIQEEKKYGNTRSLILAPYNSYISSISSLSSSDDIKIEVGLCRYRDNKVKQANIKYELNNNADFDNGVIITPNESEVESKADAANFDSASKQISPKNEMKDEINIISGLSSPNSKKRNEVKYDSKEPLTIRENIVREIEANLGYDYSYLINCLKQNEVNYATATYHLMLKEYIDNL